MDCPKCQSDDTAIIPETIELVDPATLKQKAIRACNYCNYKWEYEPDEYIDLEAEAHEDYQNKLIGETVRSHGKFCNCQLCMSW
jgi:hypothetical protein